MRVDTHKSGFARVQEDEHETRLSFQNNKVLNLLITNKLSKIKFRKILKMELFLRPSILDTGYSTCISSLTWSSRCKLDIPGRHSVTRTYTEHLNMCRHLLGMHKYRETLTVIFNISYRTLDASHSAWEAAVCPDFQSSPRSGYMHFFFFFLSTVCFLMPKPTLQSHTAGTLTCHASVFKL